MRTDVLVHSIHNPNNPMSEPDRKLLREAIQLSLERFASMTDHLRLRFLTSYIATYAMNTADPARAFRELGIAAGEALERAMKQERERGGTA